MKLFFVALLLVCTIQTAYTQTVDLNGTLLSKPWTKSTQSYCAGGSDYFVLKTDSEEVVLENMSKTKLDNFHKKQVLLKGEWHTRSIKASVNDGMQRPMGMQPYGVAEEVSDFTCRVFRVSSVRLLNTPRPKK